jgi:hypothetical protein
MRDAPAPWTEHAGRNRSRVNSRLIPEKYAEWIERKKESSKRESGKRNSRHPGREALNSP